MKTVRPLSGKGKTVTYRDEDGDMWIRWGNTGFALSSDDIDLILDEFFIDQGKWYLLGASMTEPPRDGLGEFVRSRISGLSPRHASAIAAILVNEKYLRHRGIKPIELMRL